MKKNKVSSLILLSSSNISLTTNSFWIVTSELPENAEYVHMPVLLLPCTKDKAAIAQIARENGKKYCSDVEIVDLESSHWAPCAVPDEVNSNIERFLKVKLL